MHVVSVNVGTLRPITLGARAATTSIFKAPVDGPVAIGPLGLAGDERAEARRFGASHHAVYAYPLEHYDFWQRELGHAGPYPMGQFGENLTVTGPLEHQVRVGDVIRCGTATLQVAQPRIPCRKLDHHFGLKLARRFLASRRTGYYLRVLEPGAVRPGDRFEIVDSDGQSPTLDDFVRLAHFDSWDVEGLEHLLRSRALVPGWVQQLEDTLHHARAAEGWHGFRELEVAARVDECGDVVSLVLRCPRGRALAPFRAGQFLTLAVRPFAHHQVLHRAYAISSSPHDATRYRITVRHPEAGAAERGEGLVSAFLRDRAMVGARLRVGAPRGTFTLPARGGAGGVLLVSAGIGLAPQLSQLQDLKTRSPDVPVVLVHQARHGGHLPFRDELRQLTAPPGRFRAVVAFEAPRPEDRLGRDFHAQGSLRKSQLEEALPEGCLDAWVSGPSDFVSDVSGWLRELGLPPERVRTESFGV